MFGGNRVGKGTLVFCAFGLGSDSHFLGKHCISEDTKVHETNGTCVCVCVCVHVRVRVCLCVF